MRAGEVVAERFIVERALGSGGMGTVFLASDHQTGGRVALKVLDLAADGAVERFRREARMLSELSHPGIVRYVAHGETEARVPFLVMEWLAGEDLEQRLRRGPLGVEECVTLAGRITDALAFAHECGVVHRDLKPSNVFLVDGDPSRAKLLDFGIARPLMPTQMLTRSGTLLGTLGYMAPEHAFGDGTVDPRSDLFSLGCMLFEALTGRGPFAAKHLAAVFAKVLHFEPPRIGTLRKGVPRALEVLVEQLLAKNAAARPGRARDVLEALRQIPVGALDESSGTLESSRPAASSGDAARSSKPPPDSGLRGSEQRFVSAVLMDLPESSSNDRTLVSGEALGPFENAVRVTARFGGEPTRLTDRWLLVLFRSGGSEATDQAARAAACALALQEASPGAAVALATGRADSSGALGQAVERAADLLADAATSRVVKLDGITARLVSGHFEIGNDGQLARRRAEDPNEDVDFPLLGKPTPYVGRRKDLALLTATLEEAAEERIVRRIVVTGAAGMGKTRLRREIVRRARRDVQALVLQARGDVVRAGSPASLAKQLVRAAMGLGEADPAELVRARIADYLLGLVGDGALQAGEVHDRTRDFLCELLDAPSEPASLAVATARGEPGEMAERLARAFVAWLCAECSRRLVLVVLDDLQWGDAGTLRYLDRTTETLGEKPLMIVTFARPEALELFPELCAHGAQRVELGSLGIAASLQLIRAALGNELPDELAERIAARAEGNAFYLEELIRHVNDGGNVDDGLPETVLAMAQARFERLEAEARRVLRAASVFGEAFWQGGVLRVLGTEDAPHQTFEWLATLGDREILRARPESRLAGQVEHAFRHSVLREAAYASLGDDDRVLAHGVAGAWLEENGEPDPLAIAEHWERSSERVRAAPFFSKAAMLALASRDATAATACARRGLSCEPDANLRSELLYAAAMAGALAADWETVIARSLEALPLVPVGTGLWCALAGGVIVGESFRGRIERSPEFVFRLLDPELPLEPSAPAGMCLFTSIVGLLAFGERQMAEAALERMARLDQNAPDLEPTFALYHQVTRAWWHLWVNNDLGSAAVAARRARELCAHVVDPLAQVAALHVHSNLVASIGPPDAMRAVSEEVQRTPLGTQYELWLTGNALVYEVLRGAPASYVEARRGVFAEATSSIDRALEPYLLAHAHLGAGNLEAVERYAAALLAEPMPVYQRFARAALAFVDLNRGNAASALAGTEAAMNVDVCNSTVDRTLLLLARAQALHAVGRSSDARELLAETRLFVLATISGIPTQAREDCLTRVWANVRTLALAEEWLGP
jgi:serine/threonine protein kinase